MTCRDDSEGDLSDVTESPKDETEVLRGRIEVDVEIEKDLSVWFQGTSLPLLSFSLAQLKAGLVVSGVCVFHFSFVFFVGSWGYDVLDFR